MRLYYNRRDSIYGRSTILDPLWMFECFFRGNTCVSGARIASTKRTRNLYDVLMIEEIYAQ